MRNSTIGAVDAGVGGEHEDVVRADRGQLVEPVRDGRVALQLRAEDVGRLAAERTRSRSAIRLVGTRPPARPAISIARASECPVPNACTTPSARNAAAIRSAARPTASR